jgi:Xaa-Pro dipeptidase
LSTPLTASTAVDAAFGPPEDLWRLLAGEYGPHLAILDRRLEEALAATGFDGAVIFAGDERPVFRDDQTYPFKVEPYFKQWVPLTRAPGSFLRLVPGQRPMLVYKQVDDYWHEPPRNPEGYWTQHFDIRIARTDAEARKLSGSGARWVAIGGAAERSAHGSGTTKPAINDPRFLAHLDFTRAAKTPYELLCMRGAQAAAVRGHLAVAAAFRSGVTEFDLHQAYLAASAQRETELPYPNIIGINEHAATLHYQNLRTTPVPVTRSLLIDAGAEYHGYAADITRSYAAQRDDFQALIEHMDALQQRICGEVKPGVDFMVLHALTHRQVAALLREAGIVRCSADEAVATGITRAFLPHGLGHLLGLQVHDAGGRLADETGAKREPPAKDPYLRLTRVLQPGFVVTIEPGLYFIPALLRAALERHEDKLNRSLIERLVPFGGIRIEDDVEVTQDGHRNLSREAFAAAATARSRGRK